MGIIFTVIAVILILDVATFIVHSFQGAAVFSYYLCRPLWGLLPEKVYRKLKMPIAFLIRMFETFYYTIVLWAYLHRYGII